MFAAFFGICIFAASSVWATVATLNLNPGGTEGSPGHSLVSPSNSITVFGHAVGWPNADAPLGLYDKNNEVNGTVPGAVGAARLQGTGGGALPVAFLAPVSKMSGVFPIIGVLAAVAITQLLRRRRIAQLRSSSSAGR